MARRPARRRTGGWRSPSTPTRRCSAPPNAVNCDKAPPPTRKGCRTAALPRYRWSVSIQLFGLLQTVLNHLVELVELRHDHDARATVLRLVLGRIVGHERNELAAAARCHA